MSTNVFEKILCLTEPYPPSRWKANIGPLKVSESGIEFQGKRPLSIPQPFYLKRVHNRAFTSDLMQVDFSREGQFSTVYFAVPRYGQAAKRLLNELHEALERFAASNQGEQQPRKEEGEALEKHRQAQEAEQSTQGRIEAITGAVIVGVSLAVIVIWGIIPMLVPGLFGAAMLIKGLARKTDTRK